MGKDLWRAREHLVHQTQRKRADIEVRADSDVNKPFYVDVTIVQQESDGNWAPRRKLKRVRQNLLLRRF